MLELNLWILQYSNKLHAFHKIALPVSLRDYLSKVDLELNARVKGFSCKSSLEMHFIEDQVSSHR